MTRDEFNTWTADLCRKFPAIAKWLEGLGAASALLEEWAGVLTRTDCQAALEANRRMLAGDEGDLPGSFPSDWQSLPAQVRRIAGRMTPQPEHETEPKRPSTFPAGKILRRVIELRDAGMTPEDAKAIALEEFPIGPANYEPRFDCYLCQDGGEITVASNHAILAILDGTFHKCHHREGMMRCCCQKGQQIVRKIHGREVPFEMFDQKKDFRIIDFCWSPAEVDRFRTWAEDRKAQELNRTWTPATSRHREFAP